MSNQKYILFTDSHKENSDPITKSLTASIWRMNADLNNNNNNNNNSNSNRRQCENDSSHLANRPSIFRSIDQLATTAHPPSFQNQSALSLSNQFIPAIAIPHHLPPFHLTPPNSTDTIPFSFKFDSEGSRITSASCSLSPGSSGIDPVLFPRFSPIPAPTALQLLQQTTEKQRTSPVTPSPVTSYPVTPTPSLALTRHKRTRMHSPGNTPVQVSTGA